MTESNSTGSKNAESNSAELSSPSQAPIESESIDSNMDAMLSIFFTNVAVSVLFPQNDLEYFKNKALLQYIDRKRKSLIKKLDAVAKEARSEKFRLDSAYSEGVNKKLTVLAQYKDTYNEVELKTLTALRSLGQLNFVNFQTKSKYYKEQIEKIKKSFTYGRMIEKDYLTQNVELHRHLREEEENATRYVMSLKIIEIQARRRIVENQMKIKVLKSTKGRDEMNLTHLQNEIDCAETVLNSIDPYLKVKYYLKVE